MLITPINPSQCDHRWKDATYNPMYDDQPTGFEIVDARGAIVMRPKGYQKHEIRRWKRVCAICGKVEECNEPF